MRITTAGATLCSVLCPALHACVTRAGIDAQLLQLPGNPRLLLQLEALRAHQQRQLGLGAPQLSAPVRRLSNPAGLSPRAHGPERTAGQSTLSATPLPQALLPVQQQQQQQQQASGVLAQPQPAALAVPQASLPSAFQTRSQPQLHGPFAATAAQAATPTPSTCAPPASPLGEEAAQPQFLAGTAGCSSSGGDSCSSHPQEAGSLEGASPAPAVVGYVQCQPGSGAGASSGPAGGGSKGRAGAGGGAGHAGMLPQPSMEARMLEPQVCRTWGRWRWAPPRWSCSRRSL